MLKYLLIAFLALPVLALPEKGLDLEWKMTAYPYYISTPLESFKNQQGMTLYFRSFTHPAHEKVLVVLPGRSEPAVKYAELIYDLRLKGFDIHILDHQGQGESDRLLRDSHKGHVRSFKDYVADFSQWINEHVLPQSEGKELYLFAHSMGGAIAVNYLALHPGVFKKAVLSAPMMELNTKPYSENVATLFAGLLVKIGRGQHYAPDRGPYVAEKDVFAKNEVTHSEARFNISKFIFIEWPEIALGGPTSRWVKESLNATRSIDELGPLINTPVLLLQAGKDQIVKLPRQEKFCLKAKNCKLVHYPQSGHEIFMEKDEVRDQALKEMFSFI